jgi:TRAP-type C4-dicarboxylate transport system permease large subunit
VAAVMAIAFAIARGRLTWDSLIDGLRSSAGAAVMLYMILIGASIFTYFITVARLPDTLLAAIGSMHLAPLAIVGLLLVAYIVLGTVFEETSAIVVTLPFVLPIVLHAGYDPVWWGIIMVVQVELAMIHPPIGVIVFLLHGLAPDIPMKTIYRGVVPFIIADLCVLLLLTLFPDIALWLPRKLGM